MKGYRQLTAIAPVLHQLLTRDPENHYFRRLAKQVDRVLDKNRVLANNLEETHQGLGKIAACLRYPPSKYPKEQITAEQVALEMETLQQRFHSEQKIRGPQSALLRRLDHLWQSFGEHLLHCYDIPGLPPDNLQIESLFGRLRRHQRRINGRRSTHELRVFGHYQVLFIAATQAELLDQLRRVPLAEYQEHRKKLEAAESTRRFFHRLHRDTTKTIQRLTDRYLALSSELDAVHSPKTLV